jgi:phosphoribosylglycinamide formyltransferase 1
VSGARVGVLLSGRGSNFLALQRACEAGQVPAQIVVVASNRPAAAGLAAARELGIPALAFCAPEHPDRVSQERGILEALRRHGAEWLCLAGYMRLLSAELVAAFRHRILNIHPSLLPAFPGLHAQRQALEHGVKISGCTVHFVDEGLDSGPIIAQLSVPVRDDDDEERLAARILEQEHRAYPAALGRLLKERWRVEGRRVVFEGRPG